MSLAFLFCGFTLSAHSSFQAYRNHIQPSYTASATCSSDSSTPADAMALPPRSLMVGALIQASYMFNPGAPIARDLATQFYDQGYFRDIEVRRVAIVDKTRRAVFLTSPMRVMAAWWARERDSSRAPYLSISGWQDTIPDDVASRYLAALSSGKAGSFVSVAGSTTINAVQVDEKPEAGKPEAVMEGLTPETVCWLRMFTDNFTGIHAGTSYIADELDFSVPSVLLERSKTLLLLREEETDVAMGSPMIMIEEGNIVDGIQFRGGYGSRWDDTATHIALTKPFYSPRHRPPEMNRIWTFGGQGR